MGNTSIRGKKLLILGASPNEISLVQRAQEMGIYTIVTDRNVDRKLSPAKNYADEAWDISWSDIDLLEKYCIEKQVDGVTAGYSEFRIENLILLCDRLHLPCFATMEQLEITRNKRKFKDACKKNGVPVVREYVTTEEVKSFPVILKPVDRGGSIGISVANNEKELEEAYNYAMECSVCKEVIIEDFITDAVKIDSYYTILDGEISLLTTSDSVHAEKNNSERVVQNCWLYPSRKENSYRVNVDKAVKNLIADMQIKNGYMFFSAFVNEQDEFVFFETGFRLCGGHTYAFTPLEGNVNNQDIFIYHALLGETTFLKNRIHNDHKFKTIVLNYYAKAGIIDKISGVDEIKRRKNCNLALVLAYLGEECNEEKAILTKLGMFTFSSKSVESLEEDILCSNYLFEVKDKDDNDMIYDRVSPNLVKMWWND